MNDGALACPDVLVIGEALIDVVHPVAGVSVEAVGGSPLNVAVTLARLGVEAHLATSLGDDELADRIAAHLEASGVRLCPGSRHLPRTCTAQAALTADGAAEYTFDVHWSLADETPMTARSVVHAGSIGLFASPGHLAVRRRLQEAAERPGVVVTLDPNIRPALLPPPDHVRNAFDNDLLPLADVVKLSDEDAAWLYPGLGAGNVIDHLLDAGAALVAITRGSAGCVLASPAGVVDVPSVKSRVADTIGAGDSFMGAMIHQLLTSNLVPDIADGQQLPVEDMRRLGGFAASVAAVTVSRPGADPPWLREVT